jgi:mono/diheme cytochrome c family protein
MRRLLSTALCLSLAACASTPEPAVQSPAPNAEPAPPAPAEPADAGALPAPTAEVADAGAPTPMPPADDAGAAGTTATAPTTTAPTTTATAEPTPRPTTPATGNAVAQGRAVFQRVCARCHEDSNEEGPNPNLRWPEARMRTLVRSGNSRMRAIPVSRLSEADLTLLVGYLRSIRAIQ